MLLDELVSTSAMAAPEPLLPILLLIAACGFLTQLKVLPATLLCAL